MLDPPKRADFRLTYLPQGALEHSTDRKVLEVLLGEPPYIILPVNILFGELPLPHFVFFRAFPRK
jgi:hypothetical protein